MEVQLTALEMFEKLGYELKYDKMRDTYTYISSYHNTIIEFDNILRTVRISQIDREYAQTFNTNELKAINKQIEELGWNK